MKHWSKYNDNLNNVKLKGDTHMELKNVWKALNTEFTATLNTNKELGDYDKFKSTFTALDLLAPPIGHTQRNQGMNVDDNYTRVL